MRTRTSDNWNCKPGYFDRHNLFELFESSNSYGIPDLVEDNPTIPYALVPYNVRIRSDVGYAGLGMHFFLDDYRFEQAWIKPSVGIERITKASVALSPDFSLYTDMPEAVQIYNTYRNRWLARYWQAHGIHVIPTVSWSNEKSYPFAFLGIPENQTIAISTVSINKEYKSNFLNGYSKALEILKPKAVLCYGPIMDEMRDTDMFIKSYRPTFEGLRNLRKNKE